MMKLKREELQRQAIKEGIPIKKGKRYLKKRGTCQPSRSTYY